MTTSSALCCVACIIWKHFFSFFFEKAVNYFEFLKNLPVVGHTNNMYSKCHSLVSLFHNTWLSIHTHSQCNSVNISTVTSQRRNYFDIVHNYLQQQPHVELGWNSWFVKLRWLIRIRITFVDDNFRHCGYYLVCYSFYFSIQLRAFTDKTFFKSNMAIHIKILSSPNIGTLCDMSNVSL